MGGFTKIKLKDCSVKNIKEQNKLLREFGVRKSIKFYSEDDIKFEYEGFISGDGIFSEKDFPRDKINSYKDFRKYWKALGSFCCPDFGTLDFDCYFGRTSDNAMRRLGKYLTANVEQIDSVSGSFSTFCERGMTKIERTIMKEFKLL